MRNPNWLEDTRKAMQEMADNPELALGVTPKITASYSFPPIPTAGATYPIEPGETVCGFTNNGDVTVYLNVG